MELSVQVRKATARELYSITSLTKKYFPYTGFSFTEITRRMENPSIEYYVALLDGHTAGFVDFELKQGCGQILGLAVLEEYRNFGIGQALLRKAIEQIRAAGKAKAELLVSQANPIALHLYEKHGFKYTRAFSEKYAGQNVLVYEKTL
ncbi:GNAT family N-acetyltransferase [Candidatus Micrarchaeota archaeon]|nr:GNAT family N-acetyltransferase [Candidatus Micrarchaeota archaeon]